MTSLIDYHNNIGMRTYCIAGIVPNLNSRIVTMSSFGYKHVPSSFMTINDATTPSFVDAFARATVANRDPRDTGDDATHYRSAFDMLDRLMSYERPTDVIVPSFASECSAQLPHSSHRSPTLSLSPLTLARPSSRCAAPASSMSSLSIDDSTACGESKCDQLPTTVYGCIDCPHFTTSTKSTLVDHILSHRTTKTAVTNPHRLIGASDQHRTMPNNAATHMPFSTSSVGSRKRNRAANQSTIRPDSSSTANASSSSSLASSSSSSLSLSSSVSTSSVLPRANTSRRLIRLTPSSSSSNLSFVTANNTESQQTPIESSTVLSDRSIWNPAARNNNAGCHQGVALRGGTEFASSLSSANSSTSASSSLSSIASCSPNDIMEQLNKMNSTLVSIQSDVRSLIERNNVHDRHTNY